MKEAHSKGQGLGFRGLGFIGLGFRGLGLWVQGPDMLCVWENKGLGFRVVGQGSAVVQVRRRNGSQTLLPAS